MKNFIRRNLIKFVSMVTPIIGKMAAPWTRKKADAFDYRTFVELMPDEGTILVTKTNGELGNLFIPDFWSHAGIYTGVDTVIEAVGEGVVETDIIDFMMKKDFIIAVKPKFASIPEMSKAVEYAKTQIGKPYDYSFEHSDVKAFYCSELVQWSYNQVNADIPFKLGKVLGIDSISPDSLTDSELFEIVWCSSSCKELIK